MSLISFFRTKPQKSFEFLEIDITESGISINGQMFDVPMHINSLVNVFGTPRKTKFRSSSDTTSFLEKVHGKGLVSKRVNYAWDRLGLMAYTQNGSVVSCIGIALDNSSYAYYPQGVFKGKLTINGKNWFSVMKDGKEELCFLSLKLGFYSITAEYSDFETESSQRAENDFCSVEIQLSK